MNLIPTISNLGQTAFRSFKKSFSANNFKSWASPSLPFLKDKRNLYFFIKNTFFISKYKKLLLKFLATNNLNSTNFIYITKLHLNRHVKRFVTQNSSRSPLISNLNKEYRETKWDFGFAWKRKNTFYNPSFHFLKSVNDFEYIFNNNNMLFKKVLGTGLSNILYHDNFNLASILTSHVISTSISLMLFHSELFNYTYESLLRLTKSVILNVRTQSFASTITQYNSNFKRSTTIPSLVTQNKQSSLVFFTRHNIYKAYNNKIHLSYYRYLKSIDRKHLKINDNDILYYDRQVEVNSRIYSKKVLGLVALGNQHFSHSVVSKARHINSEPIKPNLFTHTTTLQNYLFTTTLVARHSGSCFFWNSSIVSKTPFIKNSKLIPITAFTLNDDLSELSCYLKPVSIVSGVNSTADYLNNLISNIGTVNTVKNSNRQKNLFYGHKKSPSSLVLLSEYLNRGLLFKHSNPLFRSLLMRFKRLVILKKLFQKPQKFLNTSRTKKTSGMEFFQNKAFLNTKFRALQSFSKLKSVQFLKLWKKAETAIKEEYKNKMIRGYKKLKELKNSTKTSHKLVNRAAKPISTNAVLRSKRSLSPERFKVSINKIKKKFKKRISLRQKVDLYTNIIQPRTWIQSSKKLLHMINMYLVRKKRFKLGKKKFRTFKRFRMQRSTKESFDKFIKYLHLKNSAKRSDSLTMPHYLNTVHDYISRNNVHSITLNQVSEILTSEIQSHTTPCNGLSVSNIANIDIENLFFNTFFLNTSINNSLIFKYILYRRFMQNTSSTYDLSLHSIKPILQTFETFYFSKRSDLIKNSNLLPLPSFNFHIQRRMVRLFTFRKFSTSTSIWYFNMLVRFIEFCTGRKVYIKLNPFIEKSLLLTDQIQCKLWETRVAGFQRILGPRLFLKESLRIMMIALKYKDPTFLINWIKAMLYRISFWKYRSLFRYIKFVLRNLFEPNFTNLGLRGFKVKLKGKISVAGNARTRTLLFRVGQTSHSKFNNKLAHSFTLINSFTGVMGFNLWIFF